MIFNHVLPFSFQLLRSFYYLVLSRPSPTSVLPGPCTPIKNPAQPGGRGAESEAGGSGEGLGMGSCCLMSTKFQFRLMRKSWKQMVGCTIM